MTKYLFARATGIHLLVMFALITGLTISLPQRAWSYTPEHPDVQRMVNRGINFIENIDWKNFGNARDGDFILIGYAHFKVLHDPDHPVVRKGLEAAQRVVADTGGEKHEHKVNYEVSVAVLLLAAIDSKRYEPELRALQKYLFDNQMGHGGWGYPGDQDGDVSQTQYVLLAIWTLDRSGVKMDYKRVADGLQWLMRVQDPSGGWPYHGKDPGPGNSLKRQEKVSYSMALAGGSSVLIGGDALRLWGDTVDDTDPGIPNLPKAVRIYKEDTNKERRKRANLSKGPILTACGAMDGYRKANPYKRRGRDWYYYQLYTLERYESFIETANGRPKDMSPAWYNKGVDELKKYQGGDGGWADPAHSTPPISTSFAILFLIRSTQRTIFSMGEGTGRGGWGIPEDPSKAKLVNGQVEDEPIATSADELLKVLEADGADDLAGKSLPDNLKLAKDPTTRAAQLDRLERLVRGSKSWQARRVAARLLGSSDEMRVVPALIYALSDPDDPVKRYARDGLRFISRKFEGFGMPNKPNYNQLRKAQLEWRNWYLSMNPGYVFLDQE